MAVVEFQPSGWSRGSYLNVGCMWLWNVKPYVSFDVGYRVEELSPFENDAQFSQVAEELAARALEKVSEYRKLFQSIRHVSDYYLRNTPLSFWPAFDASIAHTLAGRTEVAARLLSTCVEDAPDDPAWLKGARSDARSLAAILKEKEHFQDTISSRVREVRRLLKLPALPETFSFPAAPD